MFCFIKTTLLATRLSGSWPKFMNWTRTSISSRISKNSLLVKVWNQATNAYFADSDESAYKERIQVYIFIKRHNFCIFHVIPETFHPIFTNASLTHISFPYTCLQLFWRKNFRKKLMYMFTLFSLQTSNFIIWKNHLNETKTQCV